MVTRTAYLELYTREDLIRSGLKAVDPALAFQEGTKCKALEATVDKISNFILGLLQCDPQKMLPFFFYHKSSKTYYYDQQLPPETLQMLLDSNPQEEPEQVVGYYTYAQMSFLKTSVKVSQGICSSIANVMIIGYIKGDTNRALWSTGKLDISKKPENLAGQLSQIDPKELRKLLNYAFYKIATHEILLEGEHNFITSLLRIWLKAGHMLDTKEKSLANFARATRIAASEATDADMSKLHTAVCDVWCKLKIPYVGELEDEPKISPKPTSFFNSYQKVIGLLIGLCLVSALFYRFAPWRSQQLFR